MQELSGLALSPIPVREGEQTRLLPQEDFLRFYTDGKGVAAQTAEGVYTVGLRLYELEERLDPAAVCAHFQFEDCQPGPGDRPGFVPGRHHSYDPHRRNSRLCVPAVREENQGDAAAGEEAERMSAEKKSGRIRMLTGGVLGLLVGIVLVPYIMYSRECPPWPW